MNAQLQIIGFSRNAIVNIFMKSKRDDELLNGVGDITTTPGNGS